VSPEGYTEYPFDLDFQLDILKAVIADPSLLQQKTPLFDPAYFADERHQLIMEGILSVGVNSPPSRVSLKEWVRSNTLQGMDQNDLHSEIDRIYESNGVDLGFIGSRVRDWARNRAVGLALDDSITLFESGAHDQIDARLKEALSVGIDTGEAGDDFFEGIEDRIRSYGSGEFRRDSIPTGIASLDSDDVLEGGIGRGELGLLMAAPGGGKTMGMLNFAKGALFHGYNVSYYSLEIPLKKLNRRFDMSIAGMTKQELAANPNRAIKRINRASKILKSRLRTYHFPSGALTVPQLQAHIRQEMAFGFKPDVVFVDYDKLLKPYPGTEKAERHERIEQNVLYLRGVASELSVGMWSGHQLTRSRSQEDMDVRTMEDTAESFAVQHHADVSFTINQTLTEMRNRIARLFGAKVRDGESSSVIRVVFDPFRMTMKDLDGE